MKTLRELMIEEIKPYHWLDTFYKRGDNNAKSYEDSPDGYDNWLNSLSDQEFLRTYNSTRDCINNLD